MSNSYFSLDRSQLHEEFTFFVLKETYELTLKNIGCQTYVYLLFARTKLISVPIFQALSFVFVAEYVYSLIFH